MTRAARRVVLAATASFVLTAIGCDDGDEPLISDEPEIASVVLSISPAAGGPVQYTWAGGATITPPLRIPLGTSTITATLRDASGASMNAALAADFELRMTATSNAIQFNRGNADAFTGAITATPAGNVAVMLCIYHEAAGHCDFGAEATPIPVTIGG
jgi:hypothetical protein